MYKKYIAMNEYRVVAHENSLTALLLKLWKFYNKPTLKKATKKGTLQLYREVKRET